LKAGTAQIFGTTMNKLKKLKNKKKLRWAKHVAHKQNRSAYRILVVTSVQKRPLGRSRHGKEKKY